MVLLEFCKNTVSKLKRLEFFVGIIKNNIFYAEFEKRIKTVASSKIINRCIIINIINNSKIVRFKRLNLDIILNKLYFRTYLGTYLIFVLHRTYLLIITDTVIRL